MNKRTFFPISLIVLLLISGCGLKVVNGSGKVIRETRPVSDFSSIALAGIGDVYYSQGDTNSVSVEAEDNLLQFIETEVKGDTLIIGLKYLSGNISLHPTQPIKVYVTAPDIQSITLAGSGNIFTEDIQIGDINFSLLGSGNIITKNMSANKVSVKLAGSGNFTFDKVVADEFLLKLAGSGDIFVSGKIAKQIINIDGSGDFNAMQLESETATITVNGSGNCRVWVTTSMEVNINGSGDIQYHGTPKIASSINGSGKILPSN